MNVETSSLIWELAKTYERMLEKVESEDDRRLIQFFMGCIYAAHVIYEEVLSLEVTKDDENK